jgi:uncharacterized protein with von Willebrand factor type A (vWA) domain
MGIFDKIRSAIFRRGGQQGAEAGGQGTGTINRGSAAATATSAPAAQARPAPAAAPSQRPAAPAQQAPAQPAPAAQSQVDVEAVLEKLAAEKGQKLNWRSSIVDLMKLLDLDSSLENRKELARELGYTGSTNDSATMNIWLHKQVMRKLAENGGIVPADLRD